LDRTLCVPGEPDHIHSRAITLTCI
jgi:hypothetical protein